MNLIVDMTSYEDTFNSIATCFNINNEHLVNDFFIGKDREEISASDFLSYLGKSTAPIFELPLQLNCLHVTTNADECASIQKIGIKNLQRVVTDNTPFREYLKRNGIEINVHNAVLVSDGTEYKLNRDANGASAVRTDSEGQLEYLSYKLYKDFPVWGFVCTPNALSYGGHVNRRPEFLNNISNLLGLPGLVEEWQGATKPSVIKYGLPLTEYEFPNDRQILANLLLITAYDYIIYSEPRSHEFSLLTAHTYVKPENILEIYNAEQYIRNK